MSDNHRDLVFETIKGEAQFAYFQLGVAASAIAFAVHETRDQALTDTPWATGAGVALWALSFVLGCFGINARQHGLYLNINFIEAERGSQDIRHVPEVVELMKGIRERTHAATRRPRGRFRLQQVLLFMGALAFITGHIQQMARKPSHSRPHDAGLSHVTIRTLPLQSPASTHLAAPAR